MEVMQIIIQHSQTGITSQVTGDISYPAHRFPVLTTPIECISNQFTEVFERRYAIQFPKLTAKTRSCAVELFDFFRIYV